VGYQTRSLNLSRMSTGEVEALLGMLADLGREALALLMRERM